MTKQNPDTGAEPQTFLMEFTYYVNDLPTDMPKTLYHIFISLFSVGLVVVGILKG